MRFTIRALTLFLLFTVPLAPPSFSAPAQIVEAKRIEAKVLELIRARRYARRSRLRSAP